MSTISFNPDAESALPPTSMIQVSQNKIVIAAFGALSLCGLVVGFVGLSGYLGAIGSIGRLDAIIMMGVGFGEEIVLLLVGLVICYLNGSNSQQPDPHVEKEAHSPNDDEVYADLVTEWIDSLPTEKRPLAIILNGGSGTGKSTLRDRITELSTRKFAILDSDIVKERLPDYQRLVKAEDPNAATQIHDRSAYIRRRLMEDAFKKRKCIIIDSTGADQEFWQRMIKEMQKNNYEIGIIRVETESEIAWQRCQQRAKITGRHMPKSVFNNYHNASAAAFPNLIKQVNWWAIYENNTSFKLKSHSSFQPQILTTLSL
jgi:predicted ABC-type ATPase